MRRRVRVAGHDLQVRRGESLYARPSSTETSSNGRPRSSSTGRVAFSATGCIRMCGEGMDAWALGVQNRGVHSTISPNGGNHLDCEQCGMCIDVCPVGALTSGSYRYKTRPWEMNHVSTVCTHARTGATVTLGVRQTNEAQRLCAPTTVTRVGSTATFSAAKGRFGFDFVGSAERLTTPLVRNAEGNWSRPPGKRLCGWRRAS